MIDNPLFSDVTIVTKDNRKILGHKLILAARCKEFSEVGKVFIFSLLC